MSPGRLDNTLGLISTVKIVKMVGFGMLQMCMSRLASHGSTLDWVKDAGRLSQFEKRGNQSGNRGPRSRGILLSVITYQSGAEAVPVSRSKTTAVKGSEVPRRHTGLLGIVQPIGCPRCRDSLLVGRGAPRLMREPHDLNMAAIPTDFQGAPQ